MIFPCGVGPNPRNKSVFCYIFNPYLSQEIRTSKESENEGPGPGPLAGLGPSPHILDYFGLFDVCVDTDDGIIEEHQSRRKKQNPQKKMGS